MSNLDSTSKKLSCYLQMERNGTNTKTWGIHFQWSQISRLRQPNLSVKIQGMSLRRQMTLQALNSCSAALRLGRNWLWDGSDRYENGLLESIASWQIRMIIKYYILYIDMGLKDLTVRIACIRFGGQNGNGFLLTLTLTLTGKSVVLDEPCVLTYPWMKMPHLKPAWF